MSLYGNSSTKFSNVHHLQRIADNFSEAGWSWGWVSAIDSRGRTIWIADAHRRDVSPASHNRDDNRIHAHDLSPTIL
jgi:hypothetical protein